MTNTTSSLRDQGNPVSEGSCWNLVEAHRNSWFLFLTLMSLKGLPPTSSISNRFDWGIHSLAVNPLSHPTCPQEW